jgi:hypothetical protein
MASSSDLPVPMQPLSLGNIVSAGIRLYSSHFKQYFAVALVATLWALVPLVLLAVIAASFALAQRNYGLLALLIPAWLVCAVYCFANYLAGSAAIARLAFGELTNQPESSAAATRFTQSRKWGFLLLHVLLFLLYFAVLIGFYIVLGILLGITFALAGGIQLLQSPSPNISPSTIVLLVLLFLAIVFMFVLLFCWLAARFSIVDVPLAIESEIDATKSLNRSWSLTKKSAWRIVLILSVAFLITIPLQILVWIVNNILQGVWITVTSSSETGVLLFVSILGSYILGLISSIIVLPLWQSIKAVIYYDLRNRREGMGLELRDRTL